MQAESIRGLGAFHGGLYVSFPILILSKWPHNQVGEIVLRAKMVVEFGNWKRKNRANTENRFMAASKVLGEETIAGSATSQGQQRGNGGSES